MDIGFETIGNATLICHDKGPVLVTDPWLRGGAYFGSWGLSHDVPPEQLAAIASCRYAWFSHGHPDHLHAESLPFVRDKIILLADHVGGRVAGDLKAQGFEVRILPDRRWRPLSDRIRVLSIADFNQDSILLVDVGGTLLVDLNDASNTGWGRFVKNEIARFKLSFLLALSGFGDADMINLYFEDGTPIIPEAAQRHPVGRQIAYRLERFGARYFVPFSSMHRYQRTDSLWAGQYTTRLEDYPVGFESADGELLPAFIRYDCAKGRLERIDPPEAPAIVYRPEDFGDDWSEPLEREEAGRVAAYFKRIEHLSTFLDFINVRVGGRDHVVELTTRRFDRGLAFEVPRHSLMTAVDHEVFDDLLIGNFMKTTFQGRWRRHSLRPDFSPYVAKYADNGKARTSAELHRYFAAYARRAPGESVCFYVFDHVRGAIESGARDVFRSFIPMNSRGYVATRRIIRKLVKPVLE